MMFLRRSVSRLVSPKHFCPHGWDICTGGSVVNPDLYVFGSPGPGFYHQAKIVRTLISTVL
jgi:hypothetical protein